jgi:uncharacterized protein with GYD domain
MRAPQHARLTLWHLGRTVSASDQLQGTTQLQGATMNTYLLRWKLKDDTFKRLIAKPVNRREYAKQLIESFGGLMQTYHFVLGNFDGCSISTFPSPTAMFACQMRALSTGAFERFETNLLISPEEAEEAMYQAARLEVDYRALNV